MELMMHFVDNSSAKLFSNMWMKARPPGLGAYAGFELSLGKERGSTGNSAFCGLMSQFSWHFCLDSFLNIWQPESMLIGTSGWSPRFLKWLSENKMLILNGQAVLYSLHKPNKWKAGEAVAFPHPSTSLLQSPRNQILKVELLPPFVAYCGGSSGQVIWRYA